MIASITLLAGGGAARAALPGPGGALHACIDAKGVLHVIPFAKHCPKKTTSLILPGLGNVASLNKQVSTLKGKISTLKAQNTTLTSQLGALQKTFHGVSRTGNLLTFAGINLELNSGAGTTEAAPNGLGNLIVGYNENAGPQTGSNNLVVGDGHSFTSYGGIVGGFSNTISGPYASVLGGQYNVALTPWSSIAGGCDNLTGAGSIPTGPCSTDAQAILGGASNHAIGTESTISAGQHNAANASISTVSGGLGNAADGLGSDVGGGYANTSGANESSITGGGENTATGDISTITGGYYNTATVDEATVVGGCSNVAGAGTVTLNPGCTNFGQSFMTVVGGLGNHAVNLGSSALGGYENTLSSTNGSGGVADTSLGGSSRTLSSNSNYLLQFAGTTAGP